MGLWTWYNGFIKVLVGRMLRWDNGHDRTDLKDFCYKGGIMNLVEQIRKTPIRMNVKVG